MKKIMFAIQQWWRKVGEGYHRRKIMRMEHDIYEESMHRIQVREFSGRIYLCLDEIPLVEDEGLVEEMSDAVTEARTNFFDYTYYKRRGAMPEMHK